MKKITLSLVLLVFSSLFANAQSLIIYDIDSSSFPTIKANLCGFDASGNQITNLSASDFQLTENGQSRTVTLVTCPIPKPPLKVSIAMSIDVSGSMLYGADIDMPVELGKNTARLLASLIPIPPSEFAVQTCNDQAYLVQDFTSIKSRIISAIDPINANGDNDFVEQLLNPKTGLLNIAKTGKYKRVAVLYTDAWWASLGPDELQQCKDTCSKYDIQFYAIIYSRPEAEPNGIKTIFARTCEFHRRKAL